MHVAACSYMSMFNSIKTAHTHNYVTVATDCTYIMIAKNVLVCMYMHVHTYLLEYIHEQKHHYMQTLCICFTDLEK